jgi:hypothetical protein
MDLNLRHRVERKIAHALVAEFFRNAPSEQVAPPELLAHLFGTVCQKFNFIPDESAAKRILEFASRIVAGKQRKADRLLLEIGGSRG